MHKESLLAAVIVIVLPIFSCAPEALSIICGKSPALAIPAFAIYRSELAKKCDCWKLQEESDRVAALRSSLGRLTPREHDVFMLLVRGKPHKQIAYELGTSERTVKLHRHNIVEKLEVRSLAELAVIAERLGLLPQSRSGNETEPARES